MPYTPISSASVELQDTIFCLLDVLYMDPIPSDIVPPVCLHMLSCTPYAVSTHQIMTHQGEWIMQV